MMRKGTWHGRRITFETRTIAAQRRSRRAAGAAGGGARGCRCDRHASHRGHSRRRPTSTARSACGRSSTRAAPSRSSAARRCCPRCARRWTRPRSSYVHLDELTEAIGARLAELTEAEWGLVTSGCAAALTHATAACVAGGNPDLHVRIPNLRGFAEGRSRSSRSTRATSTTPRSAPSACAWSRSSTSAELEAALGPRTAMIYILAGPERRRERAQREGDRAARAGRSGVPILVDAAAEILTIPNVHLQNGATLVGYSGGKCLRGPQTAGLLLGRKDLVKAAWVHSAPHHGFAPRLQGRQGRSDRHADGGRDVGEARPRRRVEALDRLARAHRGEA